MTRRNSVRTPLQPAPARPVSRAGEPSAREAARAADVVTRGRSVAAWSFASQQELFKQASQHDEEKRQADELVQQWLTSKSGRLPGLKIPLKGQAGRENDSQKKDEEKTPVQRAPASRSAESPSHASVDAALASPGRPLDGSARRAMESRFGHDFSRVRIHHDARTAESAASIEAAADRRGGGAA